MFKGKKIIGLIPARAGSKTLPHKNIKKMNGKPLIAWTIEEAKKSKYIDRVIVSTEDHTISSIAKKFGAEIPFMRPARLSTGNAKMVDVILDAISRLRSKISPRDLIVLLQPTSPLRIAEDIDNGIKLFFSKRAGSVISVSEIEDHPYLACKLTGGLRMKNYINPKYLNRNRQVFPAFYKVNGAMYMTLVGTINKKEGFYGSRTFAYIMPKERSVDIDDELDWKFAELLIKERDL